jgi:hypothetical protein
MDEDGTKCCTGCLKVKPLSDFYIAKNGKASGDKKVYKAKCKACQCEAARGWAKDNPDKGRLNKWRSDLKIKYGMTEEQWWEIFDKQGGKCAICGEQETSKHSSGTVFRMSVDHCHTTGKIRGILCNNCNRAIGMLKDDARMLRRAADYLEE